MAIVSALWFCTTNWRSAGDRSSRNDVSPHLLHHGAEQDTIRPALQPDHRSWIARGGMDHDARASHAHDGRSHARPDAARQQHAPDIEATGQIHVLVQYEPGMKHRWDLVQKVDERTSIQPRLVDVQAVQAAVQQPEDVIALHRQLVGIGEDDDGRRTGGRDGHSTNDSCERSHDGTHFSSYPFDAITARDEHRVAGHGGIASSALSSKHSS